MADAEMQVGNDRVSAREVRVDLREALRDVDPPRPGQPNGQQQQPIRHERPPIWDEQSPRQRHLLPPMDQQPRAQQPFSPQPRAAIGHALQTAGTATVHGLETAGTATVHGLETAGVATAHGLATAGTTVAHGLETAGSATVNGLESAGSTVVHTTSHVVHDIEPWNWG
jgi:hypothetical protein